MIKKTNKKLKSTRDAFGEAIVKAGKANTEIVVLSADLTESTRVNDFAKEYPERFIQVGVAEQNMASIAVGLALKGKIPIMTSFGVFSPGKNWDQIRIGGCYNNANIKIVSTHTGLTVGKDGATHQALEDIALTRVLPNLTVLSPADYEETKEVIKEAISIKGPVYVRLTRAKSPLLTNLIDKQTKFILGEVNTLIEGNKLAIIGTGPIIAEVILAAREINQKHPNSIKVINVPTIKPLNEDKLIKALEGIERIITLEEHQIAGGLGSLICEIIALTGLEKPKKIVRLGMKDSFGESGTYEELKKKYGLNKNQIKKVLLEELKL